MSGGIDLKVTGDARAIVRDLRIVRKSLVPKATAAALNKTARKIGTRAKREVAAAVNVPVGVIGKRIRYTKARPNRPTAWVRFLTRDIPLISLATNRKGEIRAKAQGRKSGRKKSGLGGVKIGRRFVPGGFIAQSPSGTAQVFRRKGAERYPLDVPKVRVVGAGTNRIRRLISTAGPGIFRQLFEHELRWRLEKGERRR